MAITPQPSDQMKNRIFDFGVFALFTLNAGGATTNFNIGNTAGTELRDFSGNLLTSGLSNVGNDGTVVQFGYYTMATISSPFDGTWIPLSGQGSGNAMNSTIGDKGMPDGRFSYSLAFSSLNPNIPAAGIPMTIRFYDATSLAGSSYFNAVSNTSGLWNWVTPTDLNPLISISLGDPGIVWQDGSGSAFRTTIAIPEPSCAIALALTSGVLVMRRRRMQSGESRLTTRHLAELDRRIDRIDESPALGADWENLKGRILERLQRAS